MGFPCGSAGKESACNAGGLGSIPGLGRFPGEGKGYPLQYSGLKNSMDYTVHGVTMSRTWLSDFHFHYRSLRADTSLPFRAKPHLKRLCSFICYLCLILNFENLSLHLAGLTYSIIIMINMYGLIHTIRGKLNHVFLFISALFLPSVGLSFLC